MRKSFVFGLPGETCKTPSIESPFVHIIVKKRTLKGQKRTLLKGRRRQSRNNNDENQKDHPTNQSKKRSVCFRARRVPDVISGSVSRAT